MNKRLIVVTMALYAAMIAKAQVFQMDGTEHSLSSDHATIEAGHVWGAIDDAVDIFNPFATDHHVIDCKNNDFNKVVIDGDEIITADAVQGNDNPKDAYGDNPALTLKEPISGAVIGLKAETDGWVYIVAKLSTNKSYVVFENGAAIGYKIAMENNDERVKDGVLNLEIKGTGEYNYVTLEDRPNGIGQIIREYTGDPEAASAGYGLGVLYFPVAKGCKYYACATGSKIPWSGIYFSQYVANVSLEKEDGTELELAVGDPSNPSVNYYVWSLIGDSELFGSDWDITDTKRMRTYDGINYFYTKANVALPKGTYAFKVCKNSALEETYPNNNATLTIEENATYTIKINFNAETKEISASAEKTDGIYYNFIAKGKVAEVIQNPTKYKGNVIIPETVMYEGIEYDVISIGSYAFSGCTGLKSVTIPNSVTSIGESAFEGCSGLTSITIPNSVTYIGFGAFGYCSGLSSVTIPNSVTSISESVFSNCSGLSSVTIPNSVTSIGGSAFLGCSSLTSVTIGNSVASIGGSAFYQCIGLASITIPNSVKSIGNWAFYQCSGLTSVTIGNSVTSIGDHAFSGCSGLTSITIPSSVTSIGYNAFSVCSGLTSVTIPSSVTSIDEFAFFGCCGLTSVTIPNSVTSIGGSAFSGCI